MWWWRSLVEEVHPLRSLKVCLARSSNEPSLLPASHLSLQVRQSLVHGYSRWQMLGQTKPISSVWDSRYILNLRPLHHRFKRCTSNCCRPTTLSYNCRMSQSTFLVWGIVLRMPMTLVGVIQQCLGWQDWHGLVHHYAPMVSVAQFDIGSEDYDMP